MKRQKKFCLCFFPKRLLGEVKGLTAMMIFEFLKARKEELWAQFQRFQGRAVPDQVTTLDEAYRCGLQEGFGEGLVAGVGFGLDAHKFPLTVDTTITIN